MFDDFYQRGKREISDSLLSSIFMCCGISPAVQHSLLLLLHLLLLLLLLLLHPAAVCVGVCGWSLSLFILF